MTDRVHSFQVVLDKDRRIDDAQRLIDAIRQMRGVADVLVTLTDMDSTMAECRARQDMVRRLLGVIEEFNKS